MKGILKSLWILAILAGSPLLMIQCKDAPEKAAASQKPETSAKMESVMAVHDEVMPKMGEIGKLVAELKPMADSTEAGAPYRKAMEDLQAAHTAMMDWMKGFGDRFDHEEIMQGKALSPQKQEWLEEEEAKVKAMRDQVEESLKAARELLDKEGA